MGGRTAASRTAGIVVGAVLTLVGGCVNPYVTVDTRLTGDQHLWVKLEGPAYAVVADDPRLQASLVFEECAALWSEVLNRQRPELDRVADADEADIIFTLAFDVLDLGIGVSTYPVYGSSRPHVSGYGGRARRYDSYDVVGTEVRSYHRGYRHLLFVSAWLPDAAKPAGRRVIWEGQAARTIDEADLKASMPYLTAGLGQFYGQATSEPTRIKLDKDELPTRTPAGGPAPAGQGQR